MGRKNFYAVAVGRETGIFENGEVYRKQVDGYPNAKFKVFGTKREAEVYLQQQHETNRNSYPLNKRYFSAIGNAVSKPTVRTSDPEAKFKSSSQQAQVYLQQHHHHHHQATKRKSPDLEVRERNTASTRNAVVNPYQKQAPASTTQPRTTPRTVHNPYNRKTSTAYTLAVVTQQSEDDEEDGPSSRRKMVVNPYKKQPAARKADPQSTPSTQQLQNASRAVATQADYSEEDDPFAADWLTEDIFDQLERDAVCKQEADQKRKATTPAAACTDKKRRNTAMETSKPQSKKAQSEDKTSNFGKETSLRDEENLNVVSLANSDEDESNDCLVVEELCTEQEQDESSDEDKLNTSLTQQVLEESILVDGVEDDGTTSLRMNMHTMRRNLEKFLNSELRCVKKTRKLLLNGKIEIFEKMNHAGVAANHVRLLVKSMKVIQSCGNWASHDNPKDKCPRSKDQYKDDVSKYTRLKREYEDLRRRSSLSRPYSLR